MCINVLVCVRESEREQEIERDLFYMREIELGLDSVCDYQSERENVKFRKRYSSYLLMRVGVPAWLSVGG